MPLHRYRIVRGKRSPGDPLPRGVRQDTRKHTKHCLRPPPELVTGFLENPTDRKWREFARGYLTLLATRFRQDPAPFEELADLAREEDVYLGCNCPTTKNPDVNRCHTVLALRFMQERFPSIEVIFPGAP